MKHLTTIFSQLAMILTIATLGGTASASSIRYQKIGCSLRERSTKPNTPTIETKRQVLDVNESAAFSLPDNAKMKVTSSIWCSLDGGPCATYPTLNVEISFGTSSASTSDSNPALELKVGEKVITAVCYPEIEG